MIVVLGSNVFSSRTPEPVAFITADSDGVLTLSKSLHDMNPRFLSEVIDLLVIEMSRKEKDHDS